MKKLIHKIKHLLGWYSGLPYSLTDLEKDKIVMCFKCECGELSMCHYVNFSHILDIIDKEKVEGEDL